MNQLRGALVGALVGAVAVIAWSLWGASGLDGAAATTVTVIGVLSGAVLIVLNRLADRALARAHQPAGSDSEPVTRFSRGYWVIVAGEVLAIWLGLIVLNALDAGAGRAPWVCFVVGVHFVALGLLWQARPILLLAVALLAIGLVLLIVALTGAGSADTVTAWTGILAAAAFLASSVATLVAAGRALSAAPSGYESGES